MSDSSPGKRGPYKFPQRLKTMQDIKGLIIQGYPYEKIMRQQLQQLEPLSQGGGVRCGYAAGSRRYCAACRRFYSPLQYRDSDPFCPTRLCNQRLRTRARDRRRSRAILEKLGVVKRY